VKTVDHSVPDTGRPLPAAQIAPRAVPRLVWLTVLGCWRLWQRHTLIGIAALIVLLISVP
jgi:hypothetical protein